MGLLPSSLTKRLYKYLNEKLRQEFFLHVSAQMYKDFALAYADRDGLMETLYLQRFKRGWIKTEEMSCPEGNRILVMAPHQDDETIGPGGTLIRCLDKGKSVQTVYVTDGAAGTGEDNNAALAGIRELEAKTIWKKLGGPEPIFWNLPCRKIEVSQANAQKMRHQIEQVNPDCLFLPFFLEPPTDHRVISHLLLKAHQLNPLPQNLQIWCYQVTAMLCPNIVVDITEVMEKKYQINEMWTSQNRYLNYAHYAQGLCAYNSHFLPRKKQENPTKRYAEIFFVSSLNDYIELIQTYFEPKK